MTKKAFVLLSGGIDSTTCLHIARKTYDEVEAISVDYGQRHKKEMAYARSTCSRLSLVHRILDVGDILRGEGVMLTDANVEIPDISYDEIEGVSPTYVPFRNGTLLSLITAQAQKWVMHEIDMAAAEDAEQYASRTDQWHLDRMRDAAGIFFGAHAEDAHNWAYPDCTPEFIGAMTNAIYTGTYYTVRLNAPLMSLSKAQVIEWGNKLGVDWATTWSCYAGGEYHCGTCPTCRSRIQAFKESGTIDETTYDHFIDRASDKDEIPF
jgi:7-cyano-7-deazaguanine synthase